MRTLTEQEEIEIGEDGRETIRILQLHQILAVAGAQAIMRCGRGQGAGEQARIVDALELRDMPRFVDRRDLGGVRQERAHHRLAVFDMPAEIVERIGMPALDHGIGFVGERAHATFSCSPRMRKIPASGTRSQSGRWDSS